MGDRATEEERAKFNVEQNGTSNRTTRKRGLLKHGKSVTIGILALIVIALLIALILVSVNKGAMNDESSSVCENLICNTTACEDIAQEVYSNLDTNVEPCEDFYSFACGGWLKKYPRPLYEETWDSYDMLKDQVKKKLVDIFEEPGDLTKKSVAIRAAKNLYRACVDTDIGDEVERSEFRRLLEKAGGWPMINPDWKEDRYDWEDAFVYVDYNLGYGKGTLFKVEIEDCNEESKCRKVIQIARPQNVPLAYPDDTTKVKQRRERAFRQAIRSKVTRFADNSTDLDEQLDEMIEFVKKLANLSIETKNVDTEYDEIEFTLKDGQERYKNVNWKKILTELFKNVDYVVKDDETIYWYDNYYLTHIGQLIQTTPKRAIANYISWTIAKDLDQATRRVKGSQNDAKQFCADQVEKLFPLATSYLFINKTFSQSALDELHEFTEQVKASFTLTIQQSKWMDDKTKLKAQLKLNKMLAYIASPPWLVGYDHLDKAYEGLGLLSPDDYLGSSRKVKKWKRRLQLRELFASDQNTYIVPSDINAYNSQDENKIEFPAGIFHPPFYWPEGPVALNFGAIGTTIGHEITHGFDDEGSKRDSDGNLKNWWTQQTKKKLESKIKCFINQYSNYVEPTTGRKVNGTLTLGDNIADNGGVHQAYVAYKMYTATMASDNDLRLPNEMKRFSQEQLFFISFAQQDCRNFSQSSMTDSMDRDDHAPTLFRINGPLSNSRDFSRIFKCKEGSKLNPKEKCNLW